MGHGWVHPSIDHNVIIPIDVKKEKDKKQREREREKKTQGRR